jgi:hypothetical protein
MFASFATKARPIQLRFGRQAPAALILGAFIIPLERLILLFPNVGWVIAPAPDLCALCVTAVFIVASVSLSNRSRRLVPPNLRDVR